VLSDVIGDDLAVIASGPCMPDAPTSPPGAWTTPRGCRVDHVLLGTNATAVDAAAHAARDLGYRVTVRHAVPGGDRQSTAEAVGRRLAAEALAAAGTGPLAIIEGGEATVLVPADHGVGGRNQQTVLRTARRTRPARWPMPMSWPRSRRRRATCLGRWPAAMRIRCWPRPAVSWSPGPRARTSPTCGSCWFARSRDGANPFVHGELEGVHARCPRVATRGFLGVRVT